MPDGYRVTLGTDNTLDAVDAIGGPLVTFTTDTVLGSGDWIWSGTFAGRTYENTSEPGDYVLATDGFVYFVPDFGPVDTLTSATVTAAPAYADEDGVVEGGDGDDLIDAAFADIDGSAPGAGPDSIRGGDGDDTIRAADGDDTIEGDGGADDIAGGAGADLIHGDSATAAAATDEILRWSDIADDEAELSGSFTRSTGVTDVTVTMTDDGNNDPVWSIETTDPQYTESGEPFGAASALYIFGDGNNATSTTTLVFSADDRAYSGAVEDVSFRLNDVDWGSGNHRDVVTVNAFLDGAAVAVTITPEGGDTVSGNTIRANNAGESSADAGGSVLIEIAGPADQVEIVYSNGLNGTQAIWLSDVAFTAVPAEAGADSLSGGAGDDTILGGAGADTIDGGGDADSLSGGTGADSVTGGAGADTVEIAEGDTVDGGAGDDLFVLSDLGEAGSADITLDGGTGGETAGDVLDLARLVPRASVVSTGAGAGYVDLADGSRLTFTGIEQVICFCPGTLIATPSGPRPVETLGPGDLVLTRDRGAQAVRWRGVSRASGLGDQAPWRIAPGPRFGARRALYVSPQHRMLVTGWEAELTFGGCEVLVAARHLEDGRTVARVPCRSVTYHHLAFDRHEVIEAEGAAAESFHPGAEGLAALSPRARAGFFAAFPALRGEPRAYGPTARPVGRGFEARALRA